MSTKKKMSTVHRAVIKSVFGVEPDEFVTDDFDKQIEDWARRVGHGYINGTRLRYDTSCDRWIVAKDDEPCHGSVNNHMFIPEGPLGGVDLVDSKFEAPYEILEDKNEVEYYCSCSNPKCNLPNGFLCYNPLS